MPQFFFFPQPNTHCAISLVKNMVVTDGFKKKKMIIEKKQNKDLTAEHTYLSFSAVDITRIGHSEFENM